VDDLLGIQLVEVVLQAPPFVAVQIQEPDCFAKGEGFRLQGSYEPQDIILLSLGKQSASSGASGDCCGAGSSYHESDFGPGEAAAHGEWRIALLECNPMGAAMSPANRRIDRPFRDFGSWILLLGVVALWLAARSLHPVPGETLKGFWLPACPFRTLTGFPCPFCGITTGCVWLAHGRLREAWLSNILSPFLMLGSLALGAYVLFFRMIGGRALVIPEAAGLRHALWIGVGAATAASWIVNLLRY
jgi:hypothetical protein